jgi:hypothetical protein
VKEESGPNGFLQETEKIVGITIREVRLYKETLKMQWNFKFKMYCTPKVRVKSDFGVFFYG